MKFCNTCFDADGVISSEVVHVRVTNPIAGVEFDAWVCERCKTFGRETRVTCRNYSLERSFEEANENGCE